VHPGYEYCPAHRPDRAEARKRAASLAGRSRSGSEIAGVKKELRTLADNVLHRRVDRGTGSVVAQILGVWLKAAEVEIRERETTVKEREFTEIRLPEFQELQSEVQELRELVAEKTGGVGSSSRRSPWAG
jgi:hypothetical protein